MNLAEEIRGTQVPPDHLGICWLGQAGFLLKAPDGTSMVLDPYLSAASGFEDSNDSHPC